MAKAPRPRWKNGHLDPDWLGEAGGRFVREWLAERLAGHDPYQPIDLRVAEDPDAFVVGMLREIGRFHPAFEAIARACRELLDQARKAAPDVPPYFRYLIRICQQVVLPQARVWFEEELRELARDVGQRNRREERWGGYEVGKEIAFAALVQAPALGYAASRDAWERLLDEPRYATLAFGALFSSFEEQVRHLQRWWDGSQIDERELELEQILITALEHDGYSRARGILIEHEKALSDEVRCAIDGALVRLGHRRAFVPRRSRTRAIEGAARTRKLVLADTGHSAE